MRGTNITKKHTKRTETIYKLQKNDDWSVASGSTDLLVCGGNAHFQSAPFCRFDCILNEIFQIEYQRPHAVDSIIIGISEHDYLSRTVETSQVN